MSGKKAVLKLASNNENENAARDVVRKTSPRSCASSEGVIDPFQVTTMEPNNSRKLLLKISLFEKKKHKTCVAIHHDGRCNTYNLASTPSSYNSFYTSELCEKEVQQIEERKPEPVVETLWNKVPNRMGSYNRIPSSKRKGVVTRKKSSAKTHGRSSHHRRRRKDHRRKRKVAACGQSPDTSLSACSFCSKDSFIMNFDEDLQTNGDLKNMRDARGKGPPCTRDECSQKYLVNRGQSSQAMQVKSDQFVNVVKLNNLKHLTVITPRTSSDFKFRDIDGSKEVQNSIIDLYHSLHPKFEPSASRPTIKYSQSQASFFKREVECALVQTENVRIVDSPRFDKMVQNGKTPARITRSMIVKGIFPVLSPSGEQIGSLIGSTVLGSKPKRANLKMASQPPQFYQTEWFPRKPNYRAFNTSVDTEKVLQNMTKQYEKPAVSKPCKPVAEIGIQTNLKKDNKKPGNSSTSEQTCKYHSKQKTPNHLIRSLLNPDLSEEASPCSMGATDFSRRLCRKLYRSGPSDFSTLTQKLTRHKRLTSPTHQLLGSGRTLDGKSLIDKHEFTPLKPEPTKDSVRYLLKSVSKREQDCRKKAGTDSSWRYVLNDTTDVATTSGSPGGKNHLAVEDLIQL